MSAQDDSRLDRILDRLDAIDHKLAALEHLSGLAGLSGLADQAPGFAAMVTDIADEKATAVEERGIDIAARTAAALALAERLTEPAVVEALNGFMDMAAQGKGFAAMLTDILDENAIGLADEGVDVTEGVARGTRAALKLGTMLGDREVDALHTLMTSEVLAPEAVEVVSAAAQALVECQFVERKRIGLFGLMRAMREPDIQRSLDFLLGVARRFGKALEAGGPSAAVIRTQAQTGTS